MTKSTLLQFYSIVKIVRAKDLPQLSKTYKDSQERLIVMFKKKPEIPNDKMPEWFRKWNEEVYQVQQPAWFKKWNEEVYQVQQPAWFKKWNKDSFEPRIKAIETRLDKIETRLDNHEKLFRSHGWMK